MSEVDLLVFGCVISFVTAAGAYVYFRECFTARQEQPGESESRSAEAVKREVRDVARDLWVPASEFERKLYDLP